MYKLSPSKAHRFLNCTKSLEYDVPFEENAASIRGSLLHEISEKLLTGQYAEANELLKEGRLNDYELFLIERYIERVHLEKNVNGADFVSIEEKENISLYGNSINLIIDTLIINIKDGLAIIIDLKTGRVDVDPVENEQLLFYAYYVITHYKEVEELKLCIFQKGTLREWKITKTQVLDYFFEKYPTFEKIANNDLEYNPSEKACKYCAHKKECVARANWILNGRMGGIENG